jgi:hypothetical protein
VRNLQADQDLSAQRSRLAPKLEGLPDFRHRPPFVSRTSVLGYYTVHLNQTTVNVFGILLLTTALTALSTTASEQLGERYAALATVVPIALGSLATLAQILDIRPREWFDRKDRKS